MYSLVILQFASTAITSYLAYGFLVENWGNPEVVQIAQLGILDDLQPIFDGISEWCNYPEEPTYWL